MIVRVANEAGVMSCRWKVLLYELLLLYIRTQMVSYHITLCLKNRTLTIFWN